MTLTSRASRARREARGVGEAVGLVAVERWDEQRRVVVWPRGEAVIKRPSPPNVVKDTCDHSCH